MTNQSFLYSGTGVLLVTAVVALLIGVAVFALLGRRSEVSARIAEFVAPKGDKQRSLVELALGDSDSRMLSSSPRWATIFTEIDIAGLNLSEQQLIAITAGAMVLAGWLAFVFVKSPLGALAGLLVPFIAYALIRYLADRQRRLFEQQLPDNLSVIASAMRAGQPFFGALQRVVDTAPEPSKRELRRAVTDGQLGVPLDEALGTLGERLKSNDFQQVALIATLQRETGGNTAEVVELVGDTIRERLELRAMVRALTAQGRLAGVILSGMPVALLLLVSTINPSYVHPLFHSTIGWILLGMAALMTVMGSLVIRQIIKIDL